MKMSIIEKLKTSLESHNVRPATSTAKNFGCVISGKGGPTRNTNIDPHSFDKEKVLVAKEGYVPEHARYLGETLAVIQ